MVLYDIEFIMIILNFGVLRFVKYYGERNLFIIGFYGFVL